MKLSKEKQQHLIVVVIGTVAVVVALYFLVISGQQEKLVKLAKSLKEADLQIAAANAEFAAENKKMEMLAESTNRLAQREQSMMPTNEVFSTFLTVFDGFSKNFPIQAGDVGNPQSAPLGMFDKFPYGTAVFRVRGSGYFHDFGHFLAAFESQYPFYRVKSFNLTSSLVGNPGNPGADAEKLQFDLEIVTLIRPTP